MKKIKNYFLLLRLIGRAHNTTQHNTSLIYTFAFLIILPLMASKPSNVCRFTPWTINAKLDCNPVLVTLKCGGTTEYVSLSGATNCCGWYLNALTGHSSIISCPCTGAKITLGGVDVYLDSIATCTIPTTSRSYPYIFCCPGISNACTTNGCGVVTVSGCIITISKPPFCP